MLSKENLHIGYYQSPIGIFQLVFNEASLCGLYFTENETITSPNNESDLFKLCQKQLDEYFEGTRKSFDLPLYTEGTAFRQQAWQALQTIPYGETISYLELATRVGNPRAVRAVGGANHHNPISIIIPCHRVIGKNGNLTGFGGGIWRKEWLLNHEKEHM